MLKCDNELSDEESDFQHIQNECAMVVNPTTKTINPEIPSTTVAPKFYDWRDIFPELSILQENILVIVEELRNIPMVRKLHKYCQ
jgi:hypothetical protein